MTEPPKCSRCADITWHEGELQRHAERRIEAERQLAEARLSIAERVAEREALVRRVSELEELLSGAVRVGQCRRDNDLDSVYRIVRADGRGFVLAWLKNGAFVEENDGVRFTAEHLAGDTPVTGYENLPRREVE